MIAEERLLEAALGARRLGDEVGHDRGQRGQVVRVDQRVPVAVDVLHVVVAARCHTGRGARCQCQVRRGARRGGAR